MINTGTREPRELFVALVGILNRECDLLERLVFKVSEAELLADAGEARFLTFMADEIDAVSSDLGAVETARAMLVADLCQVLDVRDYDPSLTDLSARAPQDIVVHLSELRARMVGLMGDLDEAATEGAAAASGGLDVVRATREKIEALAGVGGGYEPWAPVSGHEVGPTRFDENA